MDVKNKIIWGTVTKLSYITGAGCPLSQNNLKKAYCYPNPFVFYKHISYGITFDNLTDQAIIQIFSIAGEKVAEFKKIANNGDGKYLWFTPSRLASGVYIYVITNNKNEKVVGKLGIIK